MRDHNEAVSLSFRKDVKGNFFFDLRAESEKDILNIPEFNIIKQGNNQYTIEINFDLLKDPSYQGYSINETLFYLLEELRDKQKLKVRIDDSYQLPEIYFQEELLTFLKRKNKADFSTEYFIDQKYFEAKFMLIHAHIIMELLEKFKYALENYYRLLESDIREGYNNRGEFTNYLLDVVMDALKDFSETKPDKDVMAELNKSVLYQQIKVFLPFYALHGHTSNGYGEDEKTLKPFLVNVRHESSVKINNRCGKRIETKELLYWRNAWEKIKGSNEDKIIALLNDYAKGDKWYWLAATLHWRRHHTKRVHQIVQDFIHPPAKLKGGIQNANTLWADLKQISLANPFGSLAAIISVIEEKLGKNLMEMATPVPDNSRLNFNRQNY